MKRIFFFVLLLILGANVIAQNGNGSSGNPFWGTINSNTRWSTGDPNYGSTVYVGTSSNPDLSIGNSGHLTVDPGITVIFTELSSDMIITGSGILSAVGTSADSIVFTKASANSHWGHITFETPGSGTPISGTGSFEFCRIEYGYAATSGTDPSNAGGGIQVNATGVTIYNCLFKNNYSNFGGALTVNSGRNTAIKRCRFKSNSSNEAGGALLLWTGSTATVENCIFERNHSTGASSSVYSGGAIWVYGNSSSIVNSTFVNNTSDHPGDAIYSLSSSTAIILNSIFCGSANQFASNISSYNISYCAFETSVPANSTNSIILDAGNGGNGPNFTNPSVGDYSITFASPCRDAGTTPSPAIPYDIIGNPRVGPYDIGAYEVQYNNRWTGALSTDWFTPGNWTPNNVPVHGSAVVIGPSTHDPVITTFPVSIISLSIESNSALTVSTGITLTSATVLNRGTLTVTAGANLIVNTTFLNTGMFIIQPAGKTTVTDLLTNNGIINLNSDNTFMYSLIFNSYAGSGTVNSQVYFTGGDAGSRQFRWHYVAVPANMPKSVLTNINQFNLLRYDDSRITGTSPAKEMGWQWHDGFNSTIAFATLDVTRGYNFYTTTPTTATLTSTSLLSDLGNVNTQYSGSAPNDAPFGWNLLGNSLTCSIDWTKIDMVNGGQINNAVYFTKDNSVASYVDGSGINGGTQFIPPLQGFFVQTTAAGQSINFTGAKVHSGQSYFKGDGSDATPQVRFEIWQANKQDETVIRFKDESTNLFDGKFDAAKWLSSAGIAQIYTHLLPNDYSINTIPFPKVLAEIPVSIIIPADGTYSIQRTTLQGLDNYSVTLTDNTTGFTADLKTTSNLSFSATAGTINDRFVVKITNISTGVENPVVSNNKFNIFPSNGMINIQTVSDDWDGKSGSIRVIDLTGKPVSEKSNTEFSKNSMVQLAAPLSNGIYIVEIKSGGLRFVGKVVIR